MPNEFSNSSKRTTDPVTEGKVEGSGAPANDQDVKRRLGNFAGAGEPARKGGRTSGIVGQKTTKLRRDKRQRRSK